MPDFKAIVPGLYPLGGEQLHQILDGSGIESDVLNTRDLGDPGAQDFVILGPGSQVWYVGYSIAVSVAALPADTLGLVLFITTSYDAVVPFGFQTEQQIPLPIYTAGPFPSNIYRGKARIEAPAAQILVNNLTGQTVTASFAFWGKAL